MDKLNKKEINNEIVRHILETKTNKDDEKETEEVLEKIKEEYPVLKDYINKIIKKKD